MIDQSIIFFSYFNASTLFCCTHTKYTENAIQFETILLGNFKASMPCVERKQKNNQKAHYTKIWKIMATKTGNCFYFIECLLRNVVQWLIRQHLGQQIAIGYFLEIGKLKKSIWYGPIHAHHVLNRLLHIHQFIFLIRPNTKLLMLFQCDRFYFCFYFRLNCLVSFFFSFFHNRFWQFHRFHTKFKIQKTYADHRQIR